MINPKSEVRNPKMDAAASRQSATNSKPGHRRFPKRRYGRMVCFCFLLFAFSFWALGQTYTNDWNKISGGGGTSTGGVYTVQPPGAPFLSVLRTTTNTVCVWWPVSGTSWQLQATANFVNGGSIWSPCSYVTNGANCVYIESPPTGNRFYRLTK